MIITVYQIMHENQICPLYWCSPITGPNLQVMHLNLNPQVMHLNAHKSEVLEGLRVKKCAFWRKFLPQLGEGTAPKNFFVGTIPI